MANVTDKVAIIRNATYGNEVREGIASGIEAINTEVGTYKTDEVTRTTEFNTIKTDYDTYKNVMIAESNVAELQNNININSTFLAETAQQLILPTPGSKTLFAGDLQAGFYGFVQPSEMGLITSNASGNQAFNGANLALGCGLTSGTAFNDNIQLMKFAYKGKTLFIPQTGYRHSATWDAIYNAGLVFGTNDEGFLPPTGRCGVQLSINTADNSINTTSGDFLAGVDSSDTVATVGDSLTLKGWATTNNAIVTVVSITANKIVVSGVALITEVGNKLSRFYKTSAKITQSKKITIGDKQYRVRLMQGAGSNPTDSFADSDRGSTGPDNEWNSLILPLHERAKLSNWIYPAYAKDKDGGNIKDWGVGLTDENLRTHHSYGVGNYTWCQENSNIFTFRRVVRGYGGASNLNHDRSWIMYSSLCWRPVLELVDSTINERLAEHTVQLADKALQTDLDETNNLVTKDSLSLAKNKEQTTYNAKNSAGVLFDDTMSLKETLTTITTDSRHLAFPTIVKFLGKFYIFYRTGTQHASFDGKIVYKSSTDGITWSAETIVLSTNLYDYRDPSVVIFNGRLVLRYFYRLESGNINKTCIISTAEMEYWSAPVELPSPNNEFNASRGNMGINGSKLISLNYTSNNNTYLVTTTDLVNWIVSVPLLADKTNEGSITYVNGKYICVLRQAIYDINGSDYYNPLIWGESIDGIVWIFKDLPFYGQCPSITVFNASEYGVSNRIIITYRDMSQKDTLNRGYYNMAILNTKGELFSSRVYNMLWITNEWDLGYGDVLIDGTNVYIVYYYFTSSAGKIVMKTFNKSDFDIFSSFNHKHNYASSKVGYLNTYGGVSEKTITQFVAGDIDIQGDGTAIKAFTINLSSLNLKGSLLNVQVYPLHATGVFTSRLTAFSNTAISGILKVDSSTFSTPIKLYWSATNIE